MSELRTGIDLCEIARMAPLLENAHFLERVLTEGERAYLAGKGRGAAQTLAGLWAAKEAVLKALGTGIRFPMTDVEILHGEDGEPVCVLHGEALAASGGAAVSVSVTHEAGMAAAVCVILRP